ncbi:MAG: hypothetical protein J1G05_02145 [Clostridiales bacterium]|nr:hypothetical protein [Clostridiales bacterium]
MDEILKTSKLFYQEAVRFALCGDDIRFSSIRYEDDQFLISPLIFIERHTVELLLKSLILYDVSGNPYLNYKNIKDIEVLNENGISLSRKLINTHSLLSLINFYIYLESCKLLTDYNKKEIKKLKSTIKKLDKIDVGATYFRYPFINNKGKIKKNKRNYLIKINEKHPLETLKEGTYVLKNNNDSIDYEVKNLNIVQMEYDLTKVIIILLNLNNFHKNKKDVSALI